MGGLLRPASLETHARLARRRPPGPPVEKVLMLLFNCVDYNICPIT